MPRSEVEALTREMTENYGMNRPLVRAYIRATERMRRCPRTPDYDADWTRAALALDRAKARLLRG